jgi:hypothetical protein
MTLRPSHSAMIHQVVEAPSDRAASGGGYKEIIEHAAIQAAQDFLDH